VEAVQEASKRVGYVMPAPEPDPYSAHKQPSELQALRDRVEAVVRYLEELRLFSLAGYLGIDLADYLRFHQAPVLHRSLGEGQDVTVLLQSASHDEAQHAVAFAVDFALAVETRFGSACRSRYLSKRRISFGGGLSVYLAKEILDSAKPCPNVHPCSCVLNAPDDLFLHSCIAADREHDPPPSA